MFFEPNLNYIKMIKKAFIDQFSITDLGSVKLYLNMEITRDKIKRTLRITQITVIKKILNQFEMINCRAVSTFITSNINFLKQKHFIRRPRRNFFFINYCSIL